MPIAPRALLLRVAVLPLLSAILAIPFLSTGSRAATWLVDPSGAGDALTIQAGVNLAGAGDTVRVACGTYHERQIVLRNNVHLVSETGQPDCVTIDMQGRGRAIWAIGVYGSSITGITMANGKEDWGAAIYTLSHSVFDVVNCVFRNNRALVGGAVYSHHSDVGLIDCVFEDNYATYMGGALALDHESWNTVSGCTFRRNGAGDYGGAVWGYLLSTPEFVDTEFVANTAGRGGGGLYFLGTTPSFTNCAIAGNAAPRGGGIGGWSYTADLTACTVSGNAATEAGGGIWAEERSSLVVHRSILWGNCAPVGAEGHLEDAASTLELYCCDVGNAPGALTGPAAVSWGRANVSLDPAFCSPASCGEAPTEAGVYELAHGSPCLPANSGECGTIGAFGPGSCHRLALQPMSWGGIKSRYREGGMPR